MSERPSLAESLSGAELRRWYWTMAELQPFARELGVRAAGPKATLTGRIAAHLDGVSFVEEPPARRTQQRLPNDLDGTTVIPKGQRSTTQLREFFVDKIGSSFRFDGHMRQFLLEPNGATLDDAIAHWHDTRGTELPEQSSSLEFNRFTKEWHAANPTGSAQQARAAWNLHRSLPTDRRPPVHDPLSEPQHPG